MCQQHERTGHDPNTRRRRIPSCGGGGCFGISTGGGTLVQVPVQGMRERVSRPPASDGGEYLAPIEAAKFSTWDRRARSLMPYARRA